MKRLTTKDVAAQFGVGTDTLLRLVTNGTLADICDVSIGPTGRKSYYFYQERIDAHMKGRE